MSANIFGERFYGHRVPAWHNLGVVTQEEKGAVEALSLLGGGYWFEKRPLYLTMNGEQIASGDYAMVRSPVPDDAKERNFGYVTKQYKIVQPLRVCELFDENVNRPVDTLGMLGFGEKLFLTWKLPEFDVNGDTIKLNAFVASGYDGKFGVSLYIVSTRVVCQNTFSMALSEAKGQTGKGRGRVWAGKHNSNNLERDLGIWLAHAQSDAESKAGLMSGQFSHMAGIPIKNDDSLLNLLFKVYPKPNPIPAYFPEALKAEQQAKIDAKMEKSQKDVEMVQALFGGEGTAIDATAWGLFNAVTEYENWGRMTKKNADYSILMGNRAKTMAHAYSVISDWANKQ